MPSRSNPWVAVVLLAGSLVVAAIAAEASEIVRLDRRVAPVSQAIRLEIDAREETYRGAVEIALEVTESTDSFSFHAEGQTFERLALHGVGGEFEIEVERGEEGLVRARTRPALPPGGYTLEIDFSNRFNTHSVGLYRIESAGESYLFTQFEAIDARKAFPCWDEPEFKIPYQLTVTAPAEHLTVTNTPVVEESVNDGLRTTVFAPTKPLPSYLLALASGPLEAVPIPGLSVPGRVITPAGQSVLAGLAAEMAPPILEALEEYFGIAYPYAKLDLIAVPEFWPGAMENPGAVTYAADLLLLDPQAVTAAQRRRLAVVHAHEFAHMWFGDLVTMRWWDDLWLNESFASWMETRTVEAVYPELGIERQRIRETQAAMASDVRPSTRPIRRPVHHSAAIFEDLGLTYKKGNAVLAMVERWIGASEFRRGVKNYLEAHSWGNATADDLWSALAAVGGDEVKTILAPYLDQAGLPLISVEVSASGGLRLSQRRFLNAGVEAPERRWTVPVRLRYAVAGSREQRSVLLDGPRQELELDGPVDWIVPDDGAYGYYRWWLPRPLLLALADRAAEILSPLERIAFLGNASALLDAGSLDGGTFLELLGRFAHDAEADVVVGVLAALDDVEKAFVTEELGVQFAAYLRRTLEPAVERFGFEGRDGEGEAAARLRPLLVQRLGAQGADPRLRVKAAEQARLYLDDASAVDPSLVGAYLRIAAIEGDAELFEAYLGRLEAPRSPVEREMLLDAVGWFGDAALQKRALAYTLSDGVRPNELFSIPQAVARSDRGGDVAFAWLTGQYLQITARIPGPYAAYLPFVAGGCSADRLQAARDFFGQPEHQVDGTAANLGKVAEQVEDCLRLRAREGQAVSGFFTADSQPGG